MGLLSTRTIFMAVDWGGLWLAVIMMPPS